MPIRKLVDLGSEEGHVGAALTSVLGIAAGAAVAIAFVADSDAAGIAAGVLIGLAIVVGVTAPHEWFKRIYPRLDKLDPDDPSVKREGFKLEL